MATRMRDPAEEIEQLVIEQIRAIGRDPSLVVATIREALPTASTPTATLADETASGE